jgi:hypothetical protein
MRNAFVQKLPLFLAASLLAAPSFAVTGLFGPTDGVSELGYSSGTTPIYTNNLPSMRALGISPNSEAFSVPDRDTSFLASDGSCRNTDYLALARIASYIASSPDVVHPFILDLTWVFFQKVPGSQYPPFSCSCDQAHKCDPNPQIVVRSDYTSRLSQFRTISGLNFNKFNILGVVLNAELANVNGTAADANTVNQIATAIKNEWPQISVIGGYPTQATRSDYGMAYFPTPKFPSGLDYILTWDYSVSDPRVGPYPTMYNDPNVGLVHKLQTNQKLLYVVGTFSLDPNAGCPAHSTSGIYQGQRYDANLRAWCAWALKTNTNLTTTLLPFAWNGGAQTIISWEYAHCGGTALQPAFVSVANAAATGSSCWR